MSHSEYCTLVGMEEEGMVVWGEEEEENEAE